MIYTRARWADEAHTMVIGTDANGNTETVPADYTIFRCPDDGPIGFVNNGGVIEPYEAPVTPTNYRLYKSTLIRRLTEQEATTLKALLAAAPDKSQMLWDASEWLDSADPLFLTLREAIAGALGSDRADEILAREN
jgi:hypothetical protein